MGRYRRYVSAFLIVSLAPVASIAVLNWLIDPLQFYRRAAYPPHFSRQQRYQNPGLARNYPYDTVIIGSSLAESLASSHVEAVLGGKALNLSFAGASAHEMNAILHVALRSGRVRRVIWCFDIFAFRGAPERVVKELGDFPSYLYDRNPLNDYRYLINRDVLRDSWSIVRERISRRPVRALELDRLHCTYEPPAAYAAEKVLQKWAKEEQAYARGFRRFSGTDFHYAALCRSFERNVGAAVGSAPQVRFDLYFPPLSVLAYRVAEKEGVLADALRFKEYILERLAPLTNATVHDFQAVEEIIGDLNHYRDILHYSRDIDDFILRGIRSGHYRSGPERAAAARAALEAIVRRSPYGRAD
jgi:hypothetical protein